MGKVVLVIATLDTKGEEVKYVKEKFACKGVDAIVLDSGMRGAPIGVVPEVSRREVAEATGTDIEGVGEMRRGPAIEVMRKGVAVMCKRLYQLGRIQGVMALGGSDGAILASAGMQELPTGFPKLIVSPIFQGREKFGEFVGLSDIVLMHSMVDILGINRISRRIFDNAVGAMVGMLDVVPPSEDTARRMIGITMYGQTTPAVMKAKSILEEENFEVVVFHPNGTGGRIMEKMAQEGLFSGVLDMTTHEIVDGMFGGIHAGGLKRLEVVGEKGIPQVVVPGCVDFILCGPIDTLPKKYRKRPVYPFNPALTLVRTTKNEMIKIGRTMAEKLNRSKGSTVVLVPTKGLSMYDRPGEPIYDPVADAAFVKALTTNLNPRIKVKEVNCHINDPVFAVECVNELKKVINECSSR